jgi:hypothetical protein
LPHVARFNAGMPDSQVDFSAPAELRKWPSVNKQRVSASLGARPYLIGDCVTLDVCIAGLCFCLNRNIISTRPCRLPASGPIDNYPGETFPH